MAVTASAWTTSAGLVPACSDPRVGSNALIQISPRVIVIDVRQAFVVFVHAFLGHVGPLVCELKMKLDELRGQQRFPQPLGLNIALQ
jgi:hypothetical protein